MTLFCTSKPNLTDFFFTDFVFIGLAKKFVQNPILFGNPTLLEIQTTVGGWGGGRKEDLCQYVGAWTNKLGGRCLMYYYTATK